MKWSHQFLIAFTVISEEQNGHDIAAKDLLVHLLRRAAEVAFEINNGETEAFQLEDTEAAE